MKSFKINSIRNPFYTMLLAVLLSGGVVSCQDAKPGAKSDTSQENTGQTQSNVDAPAMDLQAAVISGNLEVVNQHIEAGTKLDTKDPMSGSTALITAATFDKVEIAKALIKAGADLSIKNNDGATALHVAAFFGRIEITQELLNAGADKSLRNNFGATPRETVQGSFSDVKPIYEFMQAQLGPLGMQLDMAELKKTRPVIAMMLQ